MARDQKTEERELNFLGSPLETKLQADLLEKKIKELQKGKGNVEKLDTQYGCFLLRNCFSLSELFYFLRTCTCFNHPALLETYNKTASDGLSKVFNVNFGNISSTQLSLPAEMGGLGVLPAFLGSPFGSSNFLTTIVSERFEDVPFPKAFLTNQREGPLDGTQTSWTQPAYVKTAQDLISRLDGIRSNVFTAHQNQFGSHG